MCDQNNYGIFRFVTDVGRIVGLCQNHSHTGMLIYMISGLLFDDDSNIKFIQQIFGITPTVGNQTHGVKPNMNWYCAQW